MQFLKKELRKWKVELQLYLDASGMAAIAYAIQTITRAVDNIVSTNQLYGGTYNCFTHSFPKQGLKLKCLMEMTIKESMRQLIKNKSFILRINW